MLALARAFVSKPQILFADEPTGNLDRNTGEEIIALLFEMQKQSNTTLVMVTHDDSLAERCQTHYKLVDGKVEGESYHVSQLNRASQIIDEWKEVLAISRNALAVSCAFSCSCSSHVGWFFLQTALIAP